MADVPSAVLSQTKNLRTRESMLLGSSLEGGWSAPFPVGDNGTSFGPYQMHEGGLLTSLGLTPTEAENANKATKAMLPIYQGAVNQVSEQKWKNDPEGAAEQAAFIAEAPAQDYYASQGTGAVDAAWTNTTNVLSGRKSTGGMPANAKTTSSGGGGGIGGTAGTILNFLGLGGIGTSFKSDLERVGLVILGSLLVIIGIVIFALPVAKSAAKEAVALRSGGKAIGLGSGAARADIERRQAIAERSLAIGEKNAAIKQQRENRLANSTRPVGG